MSIRLLIDDVVVILAEDRASPAYLAFVDPICVSCCLPSFPVTVHVRMVWPCAVIGRSAMTSKKDARKTRLRQRMIDQMRMAGLARNTQTSYVREIKCLAKAFNMSPDRLEPEQVRSWHLARIDLGLSESTTNVGLAALKFFYGDTLHQPWMIDGLRMRKVPRGLPRAMSEEEIERLLMATPDLRYRSSMTLTYACGLRISETAISRSRTRPPT